MLLGDLLVIIAHIGQTPFQLVRNGKYMTLSANEYMALKSAGLLRQDSEKTKLRASVSKEDSSCNDLKKAMMHRSRHK